MMNKMKRMIKKKKESSLFFTSCFQCCHMLEDCLSRVRSAAYPTTTLHGPQYLKRQRRRIEAYQQILDQTLIIGSPFVLEEGLHLWVSRGVKQRVMWLLNECHSELPIE